MISKASIIKRFVSYVTINTESNPNGKSCPSSNNQWNLANLLKQELETIGLQDVSLDSNCYLMATLPSNLDYTVPTIGFISHIDTSPDFTGNNVKPQIIDNYNGKDIILNKDADIVLSPKHFKSLLNYKGQTLITTDGTTLLGADDKAGITEIVSAMQYLVAHPNIKHGTIKICFTPDEEIGKGAHLFDVKKFGADWAYTMDGSTIGELEYENFNAASATVTVKGKSVHPGYAKNKLINAITLANQFMAALPATEVPEHTEGYEGFYHLHSMSGGVEQTVLEYIIRDHDLQCFKERKQHLESIVNDMNNELGQNLISLDIKDQYYNMKDKITPVMPIVTLVEHAMKAIDITPIIKPIRGGTDGSQLSYMGLPCPNIFAGGHNFHGRYEYVPVESMVKATELIVKIAETVAVNYK